VERGSGVTDETPQLERKCQVCRRVEVTVDGRGTDLTCATCLGATRQRISAIVTMSTALLGEAIRAGTQGLTSEAFALASPAADPEAWGYRRMSALAQRIDPAWLDDQVDMLHPAWVLGTWHREARTHLGLDATERPTLTEASAFLDQHLGRLAHDDAFAFTELVDDVKLCHAHVERVLHLDEHHDVGVDCPACGQARLRKDYGTTEDDDRWTCPRCRQWWTEVDYRAKVAGTYVAVSPTLTASQISAEYRVPEGSIRAWATKGEVHKRGRDDSGRQLYDVEDVLACRDRKRAG
jgi:predicted RNA-binding Zn-ribbon protein involved in translation (DUF1610 family)